MGTIKNRNSMDLTEAEDTKKRYYSVNRLMVGKVLRSRAQFYRTWSSMLFLFQKDDENIIFFALAYCTVYAYSQTRKTLFCTIQKIRNWNMKIIQLCHDLAGWDWGQEGIPTGRGYTCIYLRLIPIVKRQKSIQHCKAIILQINK